MRKDHIARRNTKMLWGKFQGKVIEKLPDWYVEWACVNYHKQQGIAILFKEELEYRNKYEKKKLKPNYGTRTYNNTQI